VTEHPTPAVRIVHGDPDEAEVAALVAGLMASAVASDDDLTRPAGWGDRARGLRGATGMHHGTGVWRWSLHP